MRKYLCGWRVYVSVIAKNEAIQENKKEFLLVTGLLRILAMTKYENLTFPSSSLLPIFLERKNQKLSLKREDIFQILRDLMDEFAVRIHQIFLLFEMIIS